MCLRFPSLATFDRQRPNLYKYRSLRQPVYRPLLYPPAVSVGLPAASPGGRERHVRPDGAAACHGNVPMALRWERPAPKRGERSILDGSGASWAFWISAFWRPRLSRMSLKPRSPTSTMLLGRPPRIRQHSYSCGRRSMYIGSPDTKQGWDRLAARTTQHLSWFVYGPQKPSATEGRYIPSRELMVPG